MTSHASQLGRQLRQLLNCFRPAKLDHNVFSVNVSEVAQPPAQGLNPVRPRSGGTETQEPDPEDFSRLLRVHSERPRSRRTERTEKFAPPHGPPAGSRVKL